MPISGKVLIFSFDAEFRILVGNLSNKVITIAINWLISIFGDIVWTILSDFDFEAWDVKKYTKF